MFRLHLITWIVALATIALVTPESYAQKGGGGGAVRGGGGAARGIGSAPRIGGGTPAPRMGNAAPRIVNPGAIQGNALKGNPIQGNALKGNPGNIGRPSAALQNLQSARIMPGNLQKGGVQPSRFNTPLHNQQFHGQNLHNQNFHDNHNHHNNTFAFWAFSPWLGFWPGLWDSPYYSFYPPYGLYDYATPMQYVNPYTNPYPYTEPPPLQQTGVSIAQIDVFVPDPNAQVFFDGSATSSKGSTRYFDSPPLQPGSTYTYTIRAVWSQGGQTMSAESAVTVTAGSQVVLDFTQSPPKVTRVR